METPENRETSPEDCPHSSASIEETLTSQPSFPEMPEGSAGGEAEEPVQPVTAAGSAVASEGLSPKPQPEAEATYRKRPIFLDFDLLQLAGIFLILDQLTKFLVRAYLPFGQSYPARGFFRFTHAENTGSAFGILQGYNTPLIAVSFVGIIVLAFIYQSQPRPTNLLRLSLGLQIGGAIGNLLDRFRLGAVTDFIDVGPWPIFNLADASIISGLALLGWILLWPGGKDAAPAMATAGDRDYSLKRRGRCVRCGRFHSGRRSGCRAVAPPGIGRRLSRRAARR